MLLHFIRILKITQTELYLLQATLTSPEPLRQARRIWRAISLAPHLACAEADVKGADCLGEVVPKCQTTPNSH